MLEAIIVRLYFWRGHKNFGDLLSVDVVKHAIDLEVAIVDEHVSGKLLAIGSILQFAKPGDVIWGAGIHPLSLISFSASATKPFDLEVLAVRGPITRDALISSGYRCPEVFGDPGILAPLVHRVERKTPRGIIYIPHISEYEGVLRTKLPAHIQVISPFQDWRNVADAIAGAELVVSGALHGLILADAYEVPNTWLRATGNEGIIKYYDYYLGSERTPSPTYSLDEALRHSPVPQLQIRQQQARILAVARNNKDLIVNRAGQ